MEEVARSLVGAGRPIIKRPRLTRLLDEAQARVIMLVAPAGYGKTTLAHEWLDARDAPSAWYTCSPASADVAALAAGVAEAAEVVVPAASERLRTRLRVTNAPESEVDVLAELLGEDLADWPDDAFLCLDDYHFTMRSPAAERFVERLLELAPLRLLIATRERPTWGTPRRVLYGEIGELGASVLAMTWDEGSSVLGREDRAAPSGLLALADGWPAAIGLAALMPKLELPDYGRLPRPLYDYIADELYHTADSELQRRLCELAIAPNPTTGLLDYLFRSNAQQVLADAVRLGFLTPQGNDVLGLHPLLRSFLEGKLNEQTEEERIAAVRGVGSYLICKGRWDDAFLVASQYSDRELVVSLIEAALDRMLADGRLSTLGEWLSSPVSSTDHPLLELATAEVAFRDARYAEAQTFATRAASRTDASPSISTRAFSLAGNAAYLRERRADALNLFHAAKLLASSPSERLAAIAGELKTLLEQEGEGTDQLFEELTAIVPSKVDELLTIRTMSLFTATRTRHFADALEAARDVVPLLARSDEPLVRTAFLNVLGDALVLRASYAEAIDVVHRELADADRYRLAFVRPHALAVKAAAELGLRDFRSALASIRELEEHAVAQDDVHSQMAAKAVKIRLRVAQGAFDAGLREANVTWDRMPGQGMHGEYLATVALAMACAGRFDAVSDLVSTVRSMTRQPEARVLAAGAVAVASISQSVQTRGEALEQLVRSVRETGNFDSLVAAYRGSPDILPPLLSHLGRELEVVLHQARDRAIAHSIGLEVPGPPPSLESPTLTPRERQVYELLLQGSRNREIARALFISESTAKVHVRNILQKLGVRSRTEAVLREQRSD